MNRLIRFMAAFILATSACLSVRAVEPTPLEIRQHLVPNNLQSDFGVPIGGDAPAGNESAGSVNPPGLNQFQGLVSFGAIPGLTSNEWRTVSGSAVLNDGMTEFSAAVAQQMRLPVARSNGVVTIVQRRAQIGATYQSRQVSFQFGSVIEVPETDEDGLLLTEVVSTAYWLPEPYTTADHAGESYYWSPNSGQVFAIQAGPVSVTWKKAVPYSEANLPGSYMNVNGFVGGEQQIPNFETNGANIFLLHTARYVASGSAVKAPRKMYWTEREFRTLGKPVAVPTARVGAVTIVYNSNFPEAVTNEFRGPGYTSPTVGTTNQPLPELRTLWYDPAQGAMFAHNQEGRVFLELLGDPRTDGSRQHLGFEIVDVFKQPIPVDVPIELGERILPPAPGALDALFPEPVQPQGQGVSFAHQRNLAGVDAVELYATRETRNQNDYLVHWLEAGQQGLKWPELFARYQLSWPTDEARYSHFVRPLIATEAEARETAVALATENVPTIEYQDPLDRPRAKFTEDFRFYTWLDETQPAHRTLLRFTSDDNVAFERVFSWLDTSLKNESFDGTVATNLTTVADVLAYPDALATYQSDLADHNVSVAVVNYANYLAARTRGVNGVWKLYVTDDASGDSGSIDAWRLEVLTDSGQLIFQNSDGLTIPSSGPATPDFPSTITVAGVNDSVIRVSVLVVGFSHTYPDDLDIFLVSPAGKVCVLMSDAGGGNPGFAGINAGFQDGTSTLPDATPLGNFYYTPANFGGSEEAAPPGETGPVLTTLSALLLPAPTVVTEPIAPIAPTEPTFFPDRFTAPRVIDATVDVGQRIGPPAGEQGATGAYLAGHINQREGTSFNPGAYTDPLAGGFEAANQGAIIPVNAVPGSDRLEVLWFRRNAASAGFNAANAASGFRTIYWPSVIGRYNLQWPASPREIVLASKLGSGTLDPLEAVGSIYRQPDASAAGYNPNEEHAIMSGGMAFATRDDLNLTGGAIPAVLTGASATYSSAPFVLLDYTAADGRPAMSAFNVLREKPSAGWVFDYIEPAGRLLQPPPPLSFLADPVEGSGDTAINYNREPIGGDGDLPVGWTGALESGIYSNYVQFTYRDRNQDFWIYRGLHSGPPVLEAGAYDTEAAGFGSLPAGTAVVGQPFQYTVHVSREDRYLGLTNNTVLPGGLTIDGLSIAGTPLSPSSAANLELVVYDLYDHTRVTNTLSLTVIASGSVIAQAPLLLNSTNSHTGSIVTFSDRPPSLAASPAPTNSFTMRYYYKTDAKFDWPGHPNPPATGSIVPYLRPAGSMDDPGSKETAALDIVYRPVWPVLDAGNRPIATLPFGGTLTVPGSDFPGLPGVRDFKTARVLYQQSIGLNVTDAPSSAVLHDATRGKFSDLEDAGLDGIPASVRADLYQGRYYFPNLPPHLATRLYMDPNRGASGSLVLTGEFKEDRYLLLNVLRGTDLTDAFNLCPPADALNHTRWTNAIGSLSTILETFAENPSVPGDYNYVKTELNDPVGVQELAEIVSDNVAVDSYALSATGPGSGYVTLVEAGGNGKFTQPGDPVSLHVFKIGGSLFNGDLAIIESDNPLSELISFQHTADLAGRFDEFEYQWKIAAPVDGQPPANLAGDYQDLVMGGNLPRYTLGGAGVEALGDNYLTLRYRPLNATHPLYDARPAATATNWSDWTTPRLAEGWIKRVLAGINPFNQRTSDLFNNQVNTDVSLITQAGGRWEGDVALNSDTINNYGLIEIYETVLRRGRSLSIESGFNYGPANDALLLAAGYLNDLYMLVGNEAKADAANPTIGIGTADNTYGDIATALFSFKGQVPTLLEEELALLRGRDDFLVPGVQEAPYYNRLPWNYTRGIDSGEAVYAVNYNIQENPNQDPDGVINADDAELMFPQGHGDAYGHYLTALKGYFSLLINSKFDWVPRVEAVNIQGKAVSVDYQDERKFVSAAVAAADAGRQVFDLTWRKDFESVEDAGWEHFSAERVNDRRTPSATRHWGMDHWASRTGQGALLNWVVGNALLPETDTNPNHEGIQIVDRSTVPELQQLVSLADGLQTAMENAEAGLSPLGVPKDGLAFDINPNAVVGTDDGTHFEQVYQRATAGLNNAVVAFDDAKDVTRLLRSEQDSLAEIQAQVASQERAFTNALVELYGTPYPDDIGPGKTYNQGYAGPDIAHYVYVDLPERTFPDLWSYTEGDDFTINIQDVEPSWQTINTTSFNPVAKTNIVVNIGSHGFFDKPADWTSQRASPGSIQQAISEKIIAHARVRQAVNDAVGAGNDLAKAISLFEANVKTRGEIRGLKQDLLIAEQTLEAAQFANDLWQLYQDSLIENVIIAGNSTSEALPKSLVVGVASGGDLTSAGRAALYAAGLGLKTGLEAASLARQSVVKALELATAVTRRFVEFDQIAPLERQEELRQAVHELGLQLSDSQVILWTINERLRERDDADRKLRALIAEGDRLQLERQIFRQRTAAVIQGYRTRDAAFRFFRNEKLERYKTLFDLAARYSLLAANAYDYETGLLDSTAGRAFVGRIVNSRALGVVQNGEPQFAGSATGDPGLSSALAEMKADWDVLRGRLGFNNPDAYGTTVSLRSENLRILPHSEGDVNWKNTLQGARKANILDDADVRRYCLQIDNGSGLPVPGIVLDFSTTIADGLNLFGKPLAPGDHYFDVSSFATKIFGVGVALEGYIGMDDPVANGGATGGASPGDPNASFLDPNALVATPHVYLIPVGVDSMRSPPLGDGSTVRSWSVNDLAIPMPFNIGASDFSTRQLWQSSDSLTEPLFSIRKHQAFRPVSTTSVFSPDLYGSSGSLQRSQFTNNRLVGRSVWNSRWKLVIPGKKLLSNPDEGLERFIQSVTDIKLHFVTYSYSGN
ncbi:MAG: subtilisin-like proprotein convertase family protein [Limisphaerales bacterium]|jgi:subtilisin-like proprotein convertase family protein